jgi:hypothetical protein
MPMRTTQNSEPTSDVPTSDQVLIDETYTALVRAHYLLEEGPVTDRARQAKRELMAVLRQISTHRRAQDPKWRPRSSM